MPSKPVPDLKLDSKNANRGTVRGKGMVERSLQQYGAGRSILVDRHGVAIAGNKTLETARELGIPVQVIESDGRTLYAIKRTDLDLEKDTAAKELGIADNRSSEVGLEWDPDTLISLRDDDDVDLDQFWFEDELADVLASMDTGTEGMTDPDDVPAVPDDPITKPGDMWLLGRHRLLCGDSTVVTDVDRLMDGRKADMVWTDPPYGVAVGDKNKILDKLGGSPWKSGRITSNLINDDIDASALQIMLHDAFTNAFAVCRLGAVWHVAGPAGPNHLIFGAELLALGVWRQTIQWVKNNSTFSPMGVDYHWQCEPIFHGWVPGAQHIQPPDRKQTTVWEIDRPTASADHPTMKPIALVERSLNNHTKNGDLVYEPFAGSGTTIIACEQVGRTCYGMELDPHYCDVIVTRWEQFTGQTATRVGILQAVAD